MNDDTPFLDADLVSAYLDNEVTAEERARIESSPDLLAQVAELTGLRTNLRSVSPAPAGVRETAMAAAMAAFGTADIAADAPADSGTTDSAPSFAPVISLAARRQRMYRVVTGVAAASVLAIGGLAVLSNRGGDDLESASFETSIPTAKAQTEAPAETIAAAAEAVTAGGAPAETVAAAATAAPAESTPAVEMVAESDIAATPFSDLPVIASSADLAAYVAAVTVDDSIRISGSDPADSAAPADVVADPFGVADTCPLLSPRLDTTTDRVLGLVQFAGEQSFVVRRGDGSVQVVSAFTCAVLTQLPPG
jgi:hypothetical protein